MPDLDEVLRRLNDMTAPDLWPTAERRSTMAPPSRRGGPSRILTAIVALSAAAAGLFVAARAFLGIEPSSPSTAVAEDERMRCRVSVPERRVQPGDVISIRATYTNVSDDLYKRFTVFPRLKITDSRGRQVLDHEFPQEFDEWLEDVTTYPIVILDPGEGITARTWVRAIWGGRLRLDAACGWGTTDQSVAPSRGGFHGVRHLVKPGPIWVNVDASRPDVPAQQALDRALEETGGLFDRCRPVVDGQPVVGVIEPPGPAPVSQGKRVRLESWDAACVALVHEYSGLTLVDLIFASPPRLLPSSPSWDFSSSGIAVPRGVAPAHMGRWTFVVTADSTEAMTPWVREGLEGTFRPPPDCGFLNVRRPPAGEFRPRCTVVHFHRDPDRWIAEIGVPFLRPSDAVVALPQMTFFGPRPPG